MSLKGLFKLAIVAVLLFTGVQFSKVYVHKTQLKKVIGDEALDARRMNAPSAEGLKGSIRERAMQDNPSLPDFEDLEVTGLGDRSADIVITARYTEVVDLLVYKHPMHVEVTGRADAPGK